MAENNKEELEDKTEQQSSEEQSVITDLAVSRAKVQLIQNQFDIAKIQLEMAKTFVDFVMNSSFKANFETRDDQGNKIVNPNDIINCVMLGMELGLQPISALTYGRALSGNLYISIKRGRALGLDDVASTQNIHVWTNKDKLIVYTGVQIVTKVLMDCGVRLNILDDAVPTYKYVDLKVANKLYDNFDPNKMVLVYNGISKETLAEELKSGKTAVKQMKYDVRTTIEFTRPNKKQQIKISYTMRQAINAGLYKGVDDDGKEVDGKANWNNHLETHLRDRCLTIGGRIIAADKLNSIYSEDEAMEIKNTIVDTTYETIK